MLSTAPTVGDGATRLWMAGVCLDALSEAEVVDQVIASLAVGRGGSIATPNVHFLRRADADLGLQSLLTGATMRVPDGMPLLWASRLARGPRLERVPGSSLIYTLAVAAAHHGRSIYIIGGKDGAAADAGVKLQEYAPGLQIAGAEGPWISNDVTAEEVEPILARLEAAKPDIVFCGMGFPKQEYLIAACRERLPEAWFLGCGAAVDFAAGHERRAPVWMQRSGLEWVHRAMSEPRRLLRRYLADIPFAIRVLAASGLSGLFRRSAWASAAQPFPAEIVLPEARSTPVEETPFPDEAIVIPSPASPSHDSDRAANADYSVDAI
jgi:N-acetylglucosaminyldiphosphoundecaprenol N-acetyl-beta-D-mannosaminyltransferase